MVVKITLVIAVMLLSACSNYKTDPTTSAISQFFKALATGDTKDLKSKKQSKDDEADWEDMNEVDGK